MKKFLVLIIFGFQVHAFGQLADGTTAPDFTLTDYNGNTHNLYSYLNADKTVFVEIFAAHCPGCWSYHLTHTMRDMYNMYGPDGTDEVMVLTLEHDQWNNHDAFIGNGEPWVTQGNWLAGTPFPIFDVENPDRGVFDDYNVTFYPVIYKICPDKIIERVFTSETVPMLYEKVEECLEFVSIEEDSELGNVYVNHETQSLIIDRFRAVSAIKILDSSGRVVKETGAMMNSAILLNDLKSGIYLFQIQTESGLVTKRFYL